MRRKNIVLAVLAVLQLTAVSGFVFAQSDYAKRMMRKSFEDEMKTASSMINSFDALIKKAKEGATLTLDERKPYYWDTKVQQCELSIKGADEALQNMKFSKVDTTADDDRALAALKTRLANLKKASDEVRPKEEQEEDNYNAPSNLLQSKKFADFQ